MNRGQRGTLTDFQKLAKACGTDPKLSAQLEPYLSDLAQVAKEAEQFRAQRDRHQADIREATRQLMLVLQKGRDLAMHVRLGVKVAYGPRDQRLVQFGIKLLREGRGGEGGAPRCAPVLPHASDSLTFGRSSAPPALETKQDKHSVIMRV
jgi:hypothetical protein